MLLTTLYDELDFKSGSLYSATDTPSSCRGRSDWIEKGEWITSAKRAGADKIFFVENNPVVVFSTCGTGRKEKIKAFNRTWCLARPRLLFLASPGEITVYDLAQKPVDIKNKKDWDNLKTLVDVSNVAERLQHYHRDNVESGRVFADRRFDDLKNRADKALIRDLKIVRKELVGEGLSGTNIQFAHALIGRSIFIRYLEDRGILREEYFLNIARQKAGWTDLLRNPVKRAGIDFSDHGTYYPRILANKEFTYALFKKLARDFNGDMFPDVDGEEKIVNQRHLTLIQDLLYGDVGRERNLFFYSYRFDIVPLDLISSIYEEFYHTSSEPTEKKTTARMDGAYYTPSVLVEFVLSRILTPDALAKNPRVMDTACGSGIFLVEAFRRIVRYRWHKNKQPLTFDDLKNILKDQIAGIEVNSEAARVAAFSLYLSMLHYLEPPAIDRQIKLGNKLPNLVASTSSSPNHYHCILPANAFDIERITSNPVWRERFGKECADVVVGNPPWGSPGTKADKVTKERHRFLVDWCKANNRTIGDEEPSQAFLWHALDFLKNNGQAGLLVSAGVLFKHNTTTQAFRKQWFDSIRLSEIFNFSHVRDFFFKGGVSPFLSIFFRKDNQINNNFYYWAAKQTVNIKKTQAIMLSKYDGHTLNTEDLSEVSIWKELWFGRLADRRMIRILRRHPRIIHYSNREESGQGFKINPKEKDAAPLQHYDYLDIGSFSRYDFLSFSTPPAKVHRFGIIAAYEGHRLLVKRGIDQKSTDKGTIIARYEDMPFCFTNAVNGIKLSSPEDWKYKTILGILWSSLARYYFFMTSSNWGLWHYEIHLDDELMQLPIVLDESNPATKEIIAVVDKLRSYHPHERDIIHHDGVPKKKIESQRRDLEATLDEAVFELYHLSEEQKDLIRDCCEVTIPFFYKPFDSIGAMQAVENDDLSWIRTYADIFCKRWNAYLRDNEEMRAEAHIGAHGTMLALEFYPADRKDPYDFKIQDNTWSYVLEQLGETLPQPMGTSQIVLDGLVHVVSDSGIIIIKRNEKRFWTRSLAREDAEATLCKRMVETRPE